MLKGRDAALPLVAENINSYWLASKFTEALSESGPLFPLLWLLLITGAIFTGLIHWRHHRRELSALNAVYAFSTLVLATVLYGWFLERLSYETKGWYYLILMGILISATEALLYLRDPSAVFRWVRIVLLLTASVWGLLHTVPGLLKRQTNMDVVASELEKRAKPGDFAIVPEWWLGVSLKHYYAGPVPWQTIPPLEDHTLHRYDQLKLQLSKPSLDSALEPIIHNITSTLRKGGRVWIIGDLDNGSATRFLNLPPAPLGLSKWAEGPYDAAWQWRVEKFLERHAVSGVSVVWPSPGVIAYERTGLCFVEGWKNDD